MKSCHLLWITSVFAVFAFFAGLIIEQGDGMFAATSVGILIATIELAGVWSVFGTGGYLLRLGISHLAGLFVFSAFIVGVSISLSFNDYGPGNGEFFSGVWRAALVIPPLSVTVQLPFWFFRGIWMAVRGPREQAWTVVCAPRNFYFHVCCRDGFCSASALCETERRK